MTVKVRGLHESEVRSNLDYWLSKTPEERISAVEVLRRQWCGTEQRLRGAAFGRNRSIQEPEARSQKGEGNGKAGETRRFRGLLELLNARGVEYLIVGGYALAFHGAPRFTGDLDVWVRPTCANAEKVLEALDAFGFGGVDITVDDLTRPDRVVQLGYPPLRIDFITSIDGVAWEEANRGKLLVKSGGETVPVIGKREFAKNKRACGRLKDLADLEALGETSEEG